MARSRDELLSAYDDAVRGLEQRKAAAIAKGDREAYDAAKRDTRETVRRLRAEARKGGKR
jgi:hypothetical protein